MIAFRGRCCLASLQHGGTARLWVPPRLGRTRCGLALFPLKFPSTQSTRGLWVPGREAGRAGDLPLPIPSMPVISHEARTEAPRKLRRGTKLPILASPPSLGHLYFTSAG
jgi:hypothetical protein